MSNRKSNKGRKSRAEMAFERAERLHTEEGERMFALEMAGIKKRFPALNLPQCQVVLEGYKREAARVAETAMIRHKHRSGCGFAGIKHVVLPIDWRRVSTELDERGWEPGEWQSVNRQVAGYQAAAKFLTKKTGVAYSVIDHVD